MKNVVTLQVQFTLSNSHVHYVIFLVITRNITSKVTASWGHEIGTLIKKCLSIYLTFTF